MDKWRQNGALNTVSRNDVQYNVEAIFKSFWNQREI